MKMRINKRLPDQLRPVGMDIDFLDDKCGVLINTGKTRVLCTASIEESVPSFLQDKGKGWVTAEYAMLPAATSSRNRRERYKISGRTQEIQRLIGRSLRSIIDLKKLGERTITIDCDVIQADGGTRTASITGGYVALHLAIKKLMDEELLATNPLKSSCAAISVGIVKGELLLDLNYQEDVKADVDMNVVMNSDGQYIEIQGTGEEAVYSRDQLNALLDLATKGIAELIEMQRQVLQ